MEDMWDVVVEGAGSMDAPKPQLRIRRPPRDTEGHRQHLGDAPLAVRVVHLGDALDDEILDIDTKRQTGLSLRDEWTPPAPRCTICDIERFEDVAEQRAHFHLDWHLYNLKRKAAGRSRVTEDEFERMEGDVSSISGSDNEEDVIVGKKGSPLVTFVEQCPQPKQFRVWRAVLMPKGCKSMSNEQVVGALRNVVASSSPWAIIMSRGGHFAGAVFDREQGSGHALVHKTVHKYIVRKKQGGRQSARDAGGGSAPKSAGASLRRHNERMLTEQIRQVLGEWSKMLDRCSAIFYHAPGANRETFFGGKKPVFRKGDGRVRKIPFSTRRPTYKEVCRVLSILSSLQWVEEQEEEEEEEEEVVENVVEKVMEETPKKIKVEEEVPKPLESTALLSAVEVKNVALVKILLEEEAAVDINVACEGGITPLHRAAMNDHRELVCLLLDAGADPCMVDWKGRTPYVVGTRNIRHTLTQYCREHPFMEWTQSGIPEGPSVEEKKKTNEERRMKKAAKRKAKKERSKQAKAQARKEQEEHEAVEKARLEREQKAEMERQAILQRAKMTPEQRLAERRRLQAEAAERRWAGGGGCAFCGAPGAEFSRLEFKYCSTACVAAHRKDLGR